MMNKVILIGNVGIDPEIRTITSESGSVKTASIRLATSERFRDRNGEVRENTEWHNVAVWRRSAEFVEKYVKKGTLLQVEGKLRTRQWTAQDGTKRYTTEVVADSIQILSRKSEGQPAPAAPVNDAPAVDPDDYGFMPGPDNFEDMP